MSALESFFASLEVPIPAKIDEIYNDGNSKLREPGIVAKRATALYLLATYGEGLIQRNCPHEESRKFIQKFI